MNNQQYHQVVKKAAQKKYRGKKAVVSKYIPSYPNSAEREMKRISNLYLKLLNQTIKEHLPVVMAMYKEERYGPDRQDSLRDLVDKVKQEIMLLQNWNKNCLSLVCIALSRKLARLFRHPV